MTGARETPTLSDYWGILRRRRRTIALATVIVVAFAAVYVWYSGAQYREPGVGRDPADPHRAVRPVAHRRRRRRHRGQGARLHRRRRARGEEAAHQRGGRAPRCSTHLTVDNPIGTLILNITYAASSPEAAQRGAQAFADAYLENRQHTADAVKARSLQRLQTQHADLDKQLADAVATIAATPAGTDARTAAEARREVIVSQISSLEASASALAGVDTSPGQLIRPADLPDSQSGPSPVLLMIAALALGAMVGVGIALFRERTDKSIGSRQSFHEARRRGAAGRAPRPSASARPGRWR